MKKKEASGRREPGLRTRKTRVAPRDNPTVRVSTLGTHVFQSAHAARHLHTTFHHAAGVGDEVILLQFVSTKVAELAALGSCTLRFMRRLELRLRYCLTVI